MDHHRNCGKEEEPHHQHSPHSDPVLEPTPSHHRSPPPTEDSAASEDRGTRKRKAQLANAARTGDEEGMNEKQNEEVRQEVSPLKKRRLEECKEKGEHNEENEEKDRHSSSSEEDDDHVLERESKVAAEDIEGYLRGGRFEENEEEADGESDSESDEGESDEGDEEEDQRKIPAHQHPPRNPAVASLFMKTFTGHQELDE